MFSFLHRLIVSLHKTSIYCQEPQVLILCSLICFLWLSKWRKSHLYLGWPESEQINSKFSFLAELSFSFISRYSCLSRTKLHLESGSHCLNPCRTLKCSGQKQMMFCLYKVQVLNQKGQILNLKPREHPLLLQSLSSYSSKHLQLAYWDAHIEDIIDENPDPKGREDNWVWVRG